MRFLLALSVLLSSPAYSHLVQIDDPELLKATDNDSGKAFEIQETCKDLGMSQEKCRSLAGVGESEPFQAKALSKCLEDRYIPPFWNQFPAAQNNEHPGARGHEVGGVRHTNTLTSKEEGRHFYTWSPALREEARDSYAHAQLERELVKRGAAKDVITKVSERTKVDHLATGVGIQSTIGVESTSGNSSLKAPMTQAEVDTLIFEMGSIAFDNPRRAGMEPDTICIEGQEFCSSESAEKVRNPNYKSSSKDSKSESGKGSTSKETAPANQNENKPIKTSSSGEEPDLIHDSIEHTDSGMWAGEPMSITDGTAIATTIDPETAFYQKSALEKCVEREKAKLENFRGSSNEDHDAQQAREAKRKLAEEMLARGACQEDVLGRDFCQDFRNEQASVRAEGSDIKQAELLRGAQEAFVRTGVCNPNLLGTDFCREAKVKWIVTPVPNAPERVTIKPGQPKVQPVKQPKLFPSK